MSCICTKCGKKLKPSLFKKHLVNCGRTEWPCPKCGRVFEKAAQLKGHLSACGVARKKRRPTGPANGIEYSLSSKRRLGLPLLPKEHVCEYCSQEFETGGKKAGHMSNCKLNPKYEQNLVTRGANIRKALTGNRLSLQHKASVSKGMLKAYKEGRIDVNTNPSGRSKKQWYTNWLGNSEFLHSSWELVVAEALDKHKIVWNKAKRGYKYTWSGEEHSYFPDFYLSSYDLFVEVKGYKTERDTAKWQAFPDKLVVLMRNEIERIRRNSNCVLEVLKVKP